jgi:hypothetical protein
MKLWESYAQAAATSNRSVVSLIWEASRLRFSHYRLGYSEYIDFQLFDNDVQWIEKRSFGGYRTQAILEDILIDDYSRILSLDKVTTYALLAGFGLPIPNIRATYRSLRPSSITSLQTAAELIQYLKQNAHRPVYLKRAFGSYGRGNLLIKGLDGEKIALATGKEEPLSEFCASLDDGRTLGWILQDPLSPHSDISTLTGSEKISGLRVHTFLSGQSTRVTKAIFKINLGLRDSDNFEHGASGNMLGAVDIASGKVIRAISGIGLKQQVNPAHPATGAKIVGFTLPNWTDVLDLVRDAQKAFPGFICPGWDIALCADGPKILEVNAFGDIDLAQHAYRKGFLDPDFLSLLRERGLEQLLYQRANGGLRSPKNDRVGARKHHWRW